MRAIILLLATVCIIGCGSNAPPPTPAPSKPTMSYSDALAKFNHEKDEMVPLIDGLNTMQTYLDTQEQKRLWPAFMKSKVPDQTRFLPHKQDRNLS